MSVTNTKHMDVTLNIILPALYPEMPPLVHLDMPKDALSDMYFMVGKRVYGPYLGKWEKWCEESCDEKYDKMKSVYNLVQLQKELLFLFSKTREIR